MKKKKVKNILKKLLYEKESYEDIGKKNQKIKKKTRSSKDKLDTLKVKTDTGPVKVKMAVAPSVWRVVDIDPEIPSLATPVTDKNGASCG